VERIGEIIIGIFTGTITVAIIAVIVSRQSQTPQVIQASASALANVVGAAVMPVATTANPGAHTFSTPTFNVPGTSP